MSADNNNNISKLKDITCSKALFKEAKELAITHKGEVYYLRITKNDKLILTK